MVKVTMKKSGSKASSTTKKLAAKSTIGHWSKSGSSGKSGKFPRLLRTASKLSHPLIFWNKRIRWVGFLYEKNQA
jgi:hypothetical protein